jgi:hypothetical protein
VLPCPAAPAWPAWPVVPPLAPPAPPPRALAETAVLHSRMIMQTPIEPNLRCSNVSSVSCDPVGYPRAGHRPAAPDPNGRLKSVSQVCTSSHWPTSSARAIGCADLPGCRLTPSALIRVVLVIDAHPPIRSEFPDLVTLQRSCIPAAAELSESSHGRRWSKRCCPVAQPG